MPQEPHPDQPPDQSPDISAELAALHARLASVPPDELSHAELQQLVEALGSSPWLREQVDVDGELQIRAMVALERLGLSLEEIPRPVATFTEPAVDAETQARRIRWIVGMLTCAATVLVGLVIWQQIDRRRQPQAVPVAQQAEVLPAENDKSQIVLNSPDKQPGEKPERPNDQPATVPPNEPEANPPTENTPEKNQPESEPEKKQEPAKPPGAQPMPQQPAARPNAEPEEPIEPEDPKATLVAGFEKEPYNFRHDLAAALESEAYEDVCRLLTSPPPAQGLALVTDLEDEKVRVPVRSIVQTVLRDHPRVRLELNDRFGDLAELRYQAAVASEDAAAIEQVATSFPGTRAAYQASLWLGDRELVLGNFAEAWQRYETAGVNANSSSLLAADVNLAARLRMAGALLGRDVGSPITEPVTFGTERLTPDQFEATISDLLANRQGSETIGGLADNSTVPAPPIGEYKAEILGDFPYGVRGWHRRREADVDIDWVSRGFAVQPTPAGLLISNRVGLGLNDPVNFKQKWYHEFGRTRGYPPTWFWTPMRPLIVGDATYSRRVSKALPRLQHADLGGRSRWSTGDDWAMLSDPMLWRGDLLLLSAYYIDQLPDRRRAIETWQLWLTRLNPADGSVVDKRPLVQLLDLWDGALACRATLLANNDLVATVGGVVLCCDLEGHVKWVRQQPIEPQGPLSLQMKHTPPIERGPHLLVTQQGMLGVECLEAATGRLVWKFEDAGLLELSGTIKAADSDDIAVCQTTTGMLALDCKSGEVRWRRGINNLSEATLVGGPGKLMCVLEQADPDRWTPTLLWLDPATGQTSGEARLAGLSIVRESRPQPRLGPWYVHDGTWYVFYEDRPAREGQNDGRKLARITPAE